MNTRNTIGMDMGDNNHRVLMLDAEGKPIGGFSTVPNTPEGLLAFFTPLESSLIALEAGTHSGWVSRLLESLGHEVLIGNPRKLRVIWDSDIKHDDRDAEMLARIARFDPELLHPIHHRSEDTQADLAVIKARATLVATRSKLISFVRGVIKSMGHRISSCSTNCFHLRLQEEMPENLDPALEPIMKSIEDITIRIHHYDKTIEKMGAENYPETKVLREISGVGPVTALTYLLTIEDCELFKKSRDVGPYLGLTPKRDQSGDTDKQLGITKAGDVYLRSLLVGSAQYILGHYGPDCELRRFGLRLAERGGKNAKKRAVVAVARKLAVLMHQLWKSGEPYDPFYQTSKNENKQKIGA